MTNHTTAALDFDGCNRECRKAGKHTLRWGGCEHAPKPEPTVSMSKVYTDPEDGYPSIGYDSYTVPQLGELITAGLRASDLPVNGDDLVDIGLVAAQAIVHRNDPEAPAVVPSVDRAALRDRIADVLAEADGWKWAPGFKATSPAYQGYQARADAVLAVLPAPADRAAVLTEAADAVTKHVARAIFALKSPQPPGSEHYRSGWDDGLEAAIDAARDELLRRLAGEAAPDNTEAGHAGGEA